MSNFGLTQIQAQAILELRLQQLTALEADTIRREHADKVERIGELRDAARRRGARCSSSSRRSSPRSPSATATSAARVIAPSENDLDIEDLIAERQMVITITQSSYIKALPLDTYRSQRRGGRGRDRHGDEGRRLHRAPLRVLDPRLPAVLHQPRQGLPQEGLRAAGAGLAARPRAATSATCCRCARASACSPCSSTRDFNEGAVPALRDPAGHRQEDGVPRLQHADQGGRHHRHQGPRRRRAVSRCAAPPATTTC